MKTSDPDVINMFEAKTNLSKLVARVQKGERITIARSGVPIAPIVPYKPPKRTVKFGTAAGQYHFIDDALVGIDPDIQEMFYGQDWDQE